MGTILSLLVGLVAGFLADMMFKDQLGLLGDLVVGLIGGLVGGYLFGLLGITEGESIIGQIFVAFIGAVVLLSVIKVVFKAA